MIEKEIAYIFNIKDIPKLLELLNIKTLVDLRSRQIEDIYFDKNTRIRNLDFVIGSTLTKKTGNNKLSREETNYPISSPDVINGLRHLSKLTVLKTRFELITTDEYVITLDIVREPFKIAILEIEANDSKNNLPDLCDLIKYKGLKSCPLSAYNYFKRHIGICGGPSSGKTETAKWLSYTINTEYGGNSWIANEFCTDYIRTNKKTMPMPTIYDEAIIFHGQEKLENSISSCHNIMISDSPLFMPYIYASMPGQNIDIDFKNRLLKSLYVDSLEQTSKYTDIIFMRSIDFKENNIRSGNIYISKNIGENITKFLIDHQIDHKSYDYTECSKILEDLFFINKLN